MYVSGNQVTFQSRQHQLATDAASYDSFQTEFVGYSGSMGLAWTNKKAQKEFVAISGKIKLSGTLPAPFPTFDYGQISVCYDNPPLVDIVATYTMGAMNGYPDGNYVEFQSSDVDMAGSWGAAGFGNTLFGSYSFQHQYRGPDQGYNGTVDVRMRYNGPTITGNWSTITNQMVTC